MKTEPSIPAPKNWRVDKRTSLGLLIHTGIERMTAGEATLSASTLNELNYGRGVIWVAMEDKPK